MKRRAAWAGVVGSWVALAACGGGGSGTGGQGGAALPTQPPDSLPLLGDDCDALVPTYCGFPFPSNVYLADDPTGASKTGKSVRFGKRAMPQHAGDAGRIEPELYFDMDGFSPATPILTHLPGATMTGLATPVDIERSLADDSPTVVLDAETGERVAHWVELDAAATNESDVQSFMIRPAKRLDNERRYIVAIRGVVDAAGAALPATPVFAALKAGELLESGSDAEKWTVYARRELYADLFAKLEGAGVGKDDLQIAWDFSTASKEFITTPMVDMRDKALAVVGADGPDFEIVSVEEFPTPADNAELLRRITVRMTVPLYLTSADLVIPPDQPIPRLNKDASGALLQNGTMTSDVLILVPRSVEGGQPHGLLQNGHGLFGDKTEGQGSYLARAANRSHYIAFAMNLYGFDEDAVDLATRTLLGDGAGFRAFPERQIQGMVNQLLGMRMMMGRVADLGITDASGTLLLDPAWLDPTVRAYRGDSQGGIMGAVYMAVSTDVTRGLLGEPGMPYTVLLNRSADWDVYNGVLQIGWGGDPAKEQLILGLLQMGWDRSEPGGFAPHIQSDLLPGTPKHAVLLHVARGDHQVSTFGAHVLARSIGAKQVKSNDPSQPVWESYFGIDEVDPGLADQSAMVEYDFGLAPSPLGNVANTDGCDPHDRVRALIPSFDQQDHFYRTGVVDWYCDGACNCTDTGPDPKQEAYCPETFADQCQ